MAMILSRLMRQQLQAIHWKICAGSYMTRAWHENAYAVNGGRFAICINVQTVAKNILGRGAIHRQSRVVAAIQAIILVLSYCYLQWRLVVSSIITSKRKGSSLGYKYHIGMP